MKNFKLNSKILEKWTPQAINCYKIGCNCSVCDINKIIESRCRMKQIVIKLVKNLGAPNIERNDIL